MSRKNFVLYFNMFSVQNSQRYLNKMTYESIRDVLFVQTGICERIENLNIFFFLIFKHVV